MYLTPFFGDTTKRLLSPVPPELVRLLDDTDGKPLKPGNIERTFVAGTAVHITKVEFPSAWTMTERVLYTPRSLAWVYLDVAGTSKNLPPAVLVLRPGIKTDQEFLAELERYLSAEDASKYLENFSDGIREAIRTKTVIADMPAEAVEMAWGYPESKRVELVGTAKKEVWRWADDLRTATLLDGRLTAFTGANASSSVSSP